MKNTSIGNLLLFLAVSSLLAASCSQQKESAQEASRRAQANPASIYQAAGAWHNQHGDTIQLSTLAGKIPIVAMVFTQCTFACSRIIADIKHIENQVPGRKKDQVVFVLVSFDSDRDQPARLRAFAKEMQLGDNWVLLHGDEETVRELAMLLNVKYKKQPNGDFAHSNGITLLDTQGTIATQVEGLGSSPKPLVDKLKRL
jgi:protein SCO1/2